MILDGLLTSTGLYAGPGADCSIPGVIARGDVKSDQGWTGRLRQPTLLGVTNVVDDPRIRE
jgi:hypothetical protein